MLPGLEQRHDASAARRRPAAERVHAARLQSDPYGTENVQLPHRPAGSMSE